jgi:DNA-binding transcriptional regulator YiaG
VLNASCSANSPLLDRAAIHSVRLASPLAYAWLMALGWIRPQLRTRQRPCNRSATAVQVTRRPAVTDLVATWTGWHANALRQALRMTNEEFAEHLDVSVRAVVYWRTRPEMVPRQGMQQILDVALQRAPELAQAQFRRLLAERDGAEPRGSAVASASADPAGLTEWLTATSTSDEEIDRIDRAMAALAEAHPLTPTGVLLTDARQLQAKVQRVLTGGRLRHRQERELLRVNGGMLAHISLLLSDLQASQAADDYGNAALLYLREAGASEAIAWYVLAKNARWSHRYVLAADLASQGLRRGSSGPMTVQLACYEANASALAGDASRAKAAMRYAEEQAAPLPTAQVTASPWSFPPERMTIFRLSVTLNTGDPDGALLAASDVGPSWEPDGAHVPAAWAQIRIGAGIACLLKDEPDGAAEQVRPMLDLPPGLRVATVTGWLGDLDRRLAGDRYRHVPIAAELRQEIREFTATALETQNVRLGQEDAK